MFFTRVLLLILFTTSLFSKTIQIDKNTEFIDILSSSQIFVDKSRNININNIEKYSDKFKENNKNSLGFGYAADLDVWIRFTISNKTNTTIKKTIEYNNPLTTHIFFYNEKKEQIKDGLFQINSSRNSITPIFPIELKPNETKTYYLKVYSNITTLIVKLNLWDSEKFYAKEIKHQLVLSLFFGAMFILAIYNLFIYFFTSDKSYLFYVLYIFGAIFHHSIYVGIANIYIFSQEFSIFVINNAPFFVILPIFALGFFTKYFLQIKQYNVHNKILNFFLILTPISIFIFSVSDMFDKYRNILPVILSLYLVYITIFSVLKKNRQAYFIILGWSIVFLALLTMYLSSAGVFEIYKYTPYIIEIAFVLEAIIFSLALADRIKQLQIDKNEANQKLLLQRQNEKERLQEKVEEKTKDLSKALDEKGLLLKEITHRVKNNMQTIVSLIRLQGDEIEDEKMYDTLMVIQNRIKAMGHLHEVLYEQDDLSHINAYEYFDMLIEDLRESYEGEIDIKYDIHTDLIMGQAIYCGLIVNELVTNAFKYAFPDHKGEIQIKLYEENSKFKLLVSDNGIGYSIDDSKPTNSLGTILVNTLAKEQLRGDINIDPSNGVTVEISWSKNG